MECSKIFEIIQKIGNIDDQEMFHVFNMGTGVVLVVSEVECEDSLE